MFTKLRHFYTQTCRTNLSTLLPTPNHATNKTLTSTLVCLIGWIIQWNKTAKYIPFQFQSMFWAMKHTRLGSTWIIATVFAEVLNFIYRFHCWRMDLSFDGPSEWGILWRYVRNRALRCRLLIIVSIKKKLDEENKTKF